MSDKAKKEFAMNRAYFGHFMEQRITNLLNKSMTVRYSIRDYSKENGSAITTFKDFKIL
jgi:hypothetical protein